MVLNKNIFYFIFLFINFINCFNYSIVNRPNFINYKITDYPLSTNSAFCSFNLPYIATHDREILSITTFDQFDLTFYRTEDQKTAYGSFIFYNLPVDNNVKSILRLSEGPNYYDLPIEIYCNSFPSTPIEYDIIKYGLFNKKLSIIIQIKSFEVDKNIKLDLSLPNIQKYIGNNIYFIQFINNDQSFFLNDEINIPLYVNGITTNITIKSPYLNNTNENLFKFEFYSLDSINYSGFLEFTTPQINNEFSFISKTNFNEIIDEPFLINSKNNLYKYLLPLFSKYKNQDTIFNLYFNSKTGLENIYSNDIKPIKFLNIDNMVQMFNTNIQMSNTNDYLLYFIQLQNVNLPTSIQFGIPEKRFNYPFGYTSVLNSNATYSFTSTENSNKNGIFTYYFGISNDIRTPILIKYNDTQNEYPITISKFNTKLMPKGRLLLQFSLYSPQCSIRSLTIYKNGDQVYDIFTLSEMITNKNSNANGTYDVEINIPRIDIKKIIIKNIYSQESVFNFGLDNFYIINNELTSLKNLTSDLDKLPSNYSYSNGLKEVKFLYNDLKITNKRISNKMYVKLDGYPIDRDLKVTFIYSETNINEKRDTVYSYYNETSKLFEFEFNIPKNIKLGNVSYIITLDSLDQINYYSSFLSNSYQLRIIESNNIDLMGPIVTNIEALSNISNQQLGWNYYIESINGFNNGYVIIRGSVDLTERNLTLNLINGDIYKGQYKILFDVVCLEQNYSIIYSRLEDTESHFTEFNVLGINKKSPYYLLVDPSLVLISNNCQTTKKNDILPDLVSFTFSPSIVTDINQRYFEFNYTVYHSTGIANYLLPTIYISTIDFKYINSSNTIIDYSNSTFTSFRTKVELPPLFGYFNYLTVSLYGVVSNSGAVVGWSSFDLNKLGKPYKINVPTGTFIPIITGSSDFSSNAIGGLWLYGNLFELATDFQIQYSDDSSNFKSIVPLNKSSTKLFLSNIRPTIYPIKIRTVTIDSNKNTLYLEPFIINPIVYNFIDPNLPSSNNNSNSETSLCKGTPLCGGPLQGTCLSNGCECKSPFVGIDCMSQIIKVPSPQIDQTNPLTNISFNNQDKQFVGIVSILGIRELNIYNEEINKHFFEQWEYKLLINDSNYIKNNYQSTIKKENQEISNVTVTLEWYKNETIVYFANSEIKLNPSTIKYTIEISSYPFTNQLNTLQLIMKTSLESSSSNNLCSNKQFGELKNQDSDYFKLQVDNNSIYGRFIKRCIKDNKIISISNQLLDNSIIFYNNNTSLNNEKDKTSFIGINIAYYEESVIIDPDFSILLDSKSIECDNNSGIGLTKTQLIGIIVGSACFFIVLVVILSLIIYKLPGCIGLKIFIYKLFKKSKV